MRPVSRRGFLSGLTTLALAGAFPRRAFGAEGTDEFSFVAINDLHYTDVNCEPYFTGLVAQINATKPLPDFCLLCGDLTENGTARQCAPMREIWKKAAMPVHAIIGNHDHTRPDDRKAFIDAFGPKLNYHFEHKGWQFIGIDTCDGQKASITIRHDTFTWLDENVPRLDKKKPTVLFTHFPLGPLMPYRPPNAGDVLDRFDNHNLLAVISGHFHGLAERTVGKTKLTTDRCCSLRRHNHNGDKTKGYFLFTAGADGTLKRNFVEYAWAAPQSHPASRPASLP